MAGKSRRWISYEIKAGNLLALNVGNRGQRVPDWHLDPLKHELIQSVLKLTRGADPWQIYHALLQPRSMLRGRSALEGVTASNLDRSEEHTSELQSLMRNSYAVFCLKKKNQSNRL